MTDYRQQHTKEYDAVAEQYESRVDALTPVTRHAVDLMAQHIKSGATILELGCGVGLASKLLTEKGFTVTCIDLSSRMISFARARNPKAQFIQGDFLKTNFGKTFDSVFAFAFIHLFPKKDAELVMKKIYEILPPDGIVYIGTTKSKTSFEGWEIKKDYDGEHKRFRKHWTEAEFKDFIAAAGFEIVGSLTQIDPFGKEWVDVVGRKRSLAYEKMVKT